MSRAVIMIVALLAMFTSLPSAGAAPTNVTVEAEGMSMSPGAGATFADSSASAGRYLMLWSNGSASMSVRAASRVTEIVVRAQGHQLEGSPEMIVLVDGVERFRTWVWTTSWTDHSIAVDLPAGDHSIVVKFTNDHYRQGVGDRNLLIDVISVRGADTAPPSGGSGGSAYFGTLPPGSNLPSGADCANAVRRSSWEPRPDNRRANQTVGSSISSIGGGNQQANSRFAPRIDGNFTGTTDEIIQWAACKWGFDENIVRAVAVKESWWRMSTVGDNGESFGLMQVRAPYHPGTYPMSVQSTAFNVDYALAWRRSCYEGYFTHWIQASTVGDEWGCVGLWFSGRWYDDGAQQYIQSVKQHLYDRTWEQRNFLW